MSIKHHPFLGSMLNLGRVTIQFLSISHHHRTTKWRCPVASPVPQIQLRAVSAWKPLRYKVTSTFTKSPSSRGRKSWKLNWVFPKIGGKTPKWMVYNGIRNTPLKWMIWGYPYFWKHPTNKKDTESQDPQPQQPTTMTTTTNDDNSMSYYVCFMFVFVINELK